MKIVFYRVPYWMWGGALCFLVSHAAILYGPFTGEDEALQWLVCQQILAAFKEQSFVEAARTAINLLLVEYHPPLRYIISLPGVWLFPHLELGVRLGAVLGSLVMTILLGVVGFRAGGKRCAKFSVLLIASSGVYTWTSMAFSWSWLTVFLVMALLLLWDPKSLVVDSRGSMFRLWAAFTCLLAAYGINSGSILFSAGLALLLLRVNFRRLPQLIALGIPVALVYAAYGFLFLVFPEHSGQLMQATYRSSMAHLNIGSFIENLMGWNAYGLPIVFNVLWILGFVQTLKTRTHLLWILLPFGLGWSFWLHGQSHQYFILVTLPLIPLGISHIQHHLKKYGHPAIWITATMLWNLYLFQVPFNAVDGPLKTQRPGLVYAAGYAGRYHNAVEPWRALATYMGNAVGRGETWVTDIQGPFGIFYFPNEPGCLGRLGSEAYPEDAYEHWDPAPDWLLSLRLLDHPRLLLNTPVEQSRVKVYRVNTEPLE